MSSRARIILMLPFLYVASVPPMLALVNYQSEASKVIVEKYSAGYFWLYENTPLRKPLQAYYNWCWLKLAPAPKEEEE